MTVAEINPYATPQATPPEDLAPLPFPKAEPGRRFLGNMFDGLLYFGLTVIGVVIARVAGFEVDPADRLDDPVVGTCLLITVGVLLPVQAVLLVGRGQSIAKVLLHMRVVRPDGGRPNGRRLFLMRMAVPAALSMIPVVSMVFGLVDGLFIFREDTRCLHDHMAGTIVVDLRKPQEDVRIRLS